MKSYKTTLVLSLALAGLFAITTSSWAQQASGGQGGQRDRTAQMQQRMEQMVKELGLNADQEKKVKALMETQAKEIRTAMQDQTQTREQRRAKMQKLQQENQAGLKKILTEDQFKKYEEMRKKQQERRGQRGNGQGGQRPPQSQ